MPRERDRRRGLGVRDGYGWWKIGGRLRRWSCHALIVLALVALTAPVALAAEFDGLQLPDQVRVDGQTLLLNGFGLRTYSFLRIPIYIAALYVQHPTTDAATIIRSPETKLLLFRFKRGVTVEQARNAWREGFEKNCLAPCRLDPADVARFLAAIPPMHAGENFSILFTRRGASVTANGRLLGVIPKLSFAEAMLATFFGPEPASTELKLALLDRHEALSVGCGEALAINGNAAHNATSQIAGPCLARK